MLSSVSNSIEDPDCGEQDAGAGHWYRVSRPARSTCSRTSGWATVAPTPEMDDALGFFKRNEPAPAPVREPPPPKTCVCGVTVPASSVPGHLDTHIIEVTTAAGHPGRSFDCPLCGPSDLVYGQPGEHPISLRNMSQAMFSMHCEEVHGVNI